MGPDHSELNGPIIGVIQPIHMDQIDVFLLQRATDLRDMESTFSEVAAMSAKGEAQIWKIMGEESRGIVVTQFIEYERESEIFVWTMAGRGLVKCAEPLVATLEAFARHLGASKIRAIAKFGLARMLHPLGFEPRAVMLVKEIK